MASYPAERVRTIGLTIATWDAVTSELRRSHPALAADLAVAVHAQADRADVWHIPVTVVPISLSPANACLVHEAAVAAVRHASDSVHASGDAAALASDVAVVRHRGRHQL